MHIDMISIKFDHFLDVFLILDFFKTFDFRNLIKQTLPNPTYLISNYFWKNMFQGNH